MFFEILQVLACFEMFYGDFDAATLAFADGGLQRLGSAEFFCGRGQIAEIDKDAEKTYMGHGDLRIEAEGLIEGTGGVDPDVIVEIGNALIVESLGVRVAGGDAILDVADIVAKRDGKLQDVARNVAHGSIHMGGVVVLNGGIGLSVRERGGKRECKEQNDFSHEAAV